MTKLSKDYGTLVLIVAAVLVLGLLVLNMSQQTVTYTAITREPAPAVSSSVEPTPSGGESGGASVPVTIQATRSPTRQVPSSKPIQGGTCQLDQALSQVGVDEADWSIANQLIFRESTCNHLAVNPTSGAYGYCQALPASKMANAGSDWRTNPLTQLRWCQLYMESRYGTWADAWTFWQQNRWW